MIKYNNFWKWYCWLFFYIDLLRYLYIFDCLLFNYCILFVHKPQFFYYMTLCVNFCNSQCVKFIKSRRGVKIIFVFLFTSTCKLCTKKSSHSELLKNNHMLFFYIFYFKKYDFPRILCIACIVDYFYITFNNLNCVWMKSSH